MDAEKIERRKKTESEKCFFRLKLEIQNFFLLLSLIFTSLINKHTQERNGEKIMLIK